MNDDQLDDLKQFIESRISQSESVLEEKIKELDGKVENFRAEMHDGFAGVVRRSMRSMNGWMKVKSRSINVLLNSSSNQPNECYIIKI